MTNALMRVDASAFVAYLRRLDPALNSAARQAFGQGVAYAAEVARSTKKFKDRTGQLRRSIERKQTSAYRFVLRATAKHALYVEENTKPHVIVPKKPGGVLVFMWRGKLTFRSKVNHPGTTGTHFMRDAGVAGETMIRRFTEVGFNQAIARD